MFRLRTSMPFSALAIPMAALTGLVLFAAPDDARADVAAPPQNVVGLSASASVERAQDQLSIVLFTRREGPDAAVLQAELKTALDEALKLARPVAKPGQLDVRTGAFSVSPRYAPRGGTNGWSGTAELVIEGRDTAGVAALAGRIGTLSVSRVTWSLSREQQEAAEDEVAATAIARFRAKADRAAKDFGFSGWLLREVTVDGGASRPVPLPRTMAVRSASAEAVSEPVPVEAGQATVTVTVSGSVQLTR
jgi:predicted secreted protein